MFRFELASIYIMHSPLHAVSTTHACTYQVRGRPRIEYSTKWYPAHPSPQSRPSPSWPGKSRRRQCPMQFQPFPKRHRSTSWARIRPACSTTLNQQRPYSLSATDILVVSPASLRAALLAVTVWSIWRRWMGVWRVDMYWLDDGLSRECWWSVFKCFVWVFLLMIVFIVGVHDDDTFWLGWTPSGNYPYLVRRCPCLLYMISCASLSVMTLLELLILWMVFMN